MVSLSILILVVMGYRFNSFVGKVQQGGLVQFDSRPNGANIVVDDIQLSRKTASSITLSSGAHEVKMYREGFNEWQKKVSVKPGAVLWLNYARLLPIKPNPSEVQQYPALSSAVTSHDNKQMALVDTTGSSLVVVDLNSDEVLAKTIQIDKDASGAPEHSADSHYSLIGWDYDDRYLLVKRQIGERIEYLSVDSRWSDPTKNITNLLGSDILKIDYSYNGANYIYVLTASHELRKIDLASSSISGPLLQNIADFDQFNKNTIYYKTNPDQHGVVSVGYLTQGASRPKTVKSSDGQTGSSIGLSMGRYYNADYIVLTDNRSVEVLKADLPPSDSDSKVSTRSVVKFQAKFDISQIGFSPAENRFVYVYGKDQTATVDLELLSVAEVKSPVSHQGRLNWVDGYHLSSVENGQAGLVEFDGTNYQMISKNNALDFPVSISNNNKYLYYFIGNGSGATLERIKLTAS